MKNFLKEKEPDDDKIVLSDLHVGCVVGFGFMPQRNITGKRLPVTEVNSYLFGEDNFVAYRLQDDQSDINLIVAENTGTDTYLALSQRIEESFFESLFGALPPLKWFTLSNGNFVNVSTTFSNAPTGWFAQQYRLIMTTEGRLLEGDFRMRSPVGRLNLSRPFSYVLLVDENNSHALEAERYEDGTYTAYATVYRPATDIGEISRIALVRSNTADIIKTNLSAPVLPETPPLPAFTKTGKFEPLPPSPSSESLHSFVEETRNDTTQVHGKFGLLQPATPSAQDISMHGMLACDTKLAGRIIDEAIRNQMMLSELIRKVIDLPARISEQILIPFSLTDAEYSELARRYQLAITDKEVVKQHILEELKSFMGENKKG